MHPSNHPNIRWIDVAVSQKLDGLSRVEIEEHVRTLSLPRYLHDTLPGPLPSEMN